jgi:hypothetical protein
MFPKEASIKIEETLNEVMSMDEDWEEGDILVEWALIGYIDNPDSEKESAYPIFYSNGEMAKHRARGLFTTALYFLNRDDNDDEE